MIRKYKGEDIETILNIWNQASSLAHPFLDSSFVKKVEKDMRDVYIPDSETWVYEEDGTILGFISMLGNEIAGLFVLPEYHSKGVGTSLVNFIHNFHEELEVEVFEKNVIGRTFYEKYGFRPMKEYRDAASNYKVLRLKIRKNSFANRLKQNKKSAVEFYKMAYEGDPKKTTDWYVGDEYIQHNPLVEDGAQPLIDYFERMAKEYPDKSIEFVRTVAEEDLVALHTHQIWPGGDEYVTMDFFRFDENEKIVEHWDAMQQIPKTSANKNTMY